MAMNPKVNWFFEKETPWRDAYLALRDLLLDCGLDEELKWGCPCYTVNQKNVVLMHGFKEYCALLFHKGALLRDPEGILVQQTGNVQAARQIRFTTVGQVHQLAAVVRECVRQATELELAGAKVVMKKTAEFEVPEEFARKLEASPALAEAFHALTPGRQRGYLLHFSSAKQSATREARIERNTERILEGKGLDD